MPRISNKQLLYSSDSESENEPMPSVIEGNKELPPDKDNESNIGLDITLPQSKNLVSAVTGEMTSTPKQCSTINALGIRLDSLIDAHRSRLKHLRQELKADNLEFLTIVESELMGENVTYNNENLKPVIYKGRNLMDLVAGSDPCRFGRELAKALFGENENCLLQDYMIGQQRCKIKLRPRIDFALEKMFNTVVKQKYPREPEYCLREARSAANQLGLDYKKKCAKESKKADK